MSTTKTTSRATTAVAHDGITAPIPDDDIAAQAIRSAPTFASQSAAPAATEADTAAADEVTVQKTAGDKVADKAASEEGPEGQAQAHAHAHAKAQAPSQAQEEVDEEAEYAHPQAHSQAHPHAHEEVDDGGYEVAELSREEARAEGSIEEGLGQVGLAQYGDLFFTLGITGERTEIANLDEAGMIDIVDTCVDEGGMGLRLTLTGFHA